MSKEESKVMVAEELFGELWRIFHSCEAKGIPYDEYFKQAISTIKERDKLIMKAQKEICSEEANAFYDGQIDKDSILNAPDAI